MEEFAVNRWIPQRDVEECYLKLAIHVFLLHFVFVFFNKFCENLLKIINCSMTRISILISLLVLKCWWLCDDGISSPILNGISLR